MTDEIDYKALFEQLRDERNNLLQVSEVRYKEIQNLQKLVSQHQKDSEELRGIKDLLGVTALELAFKERTADSREEVRDIIREYMHQEFDLDDHLGSVHDWSNYIDYVTTEELDDKVKEAIDNLEFRVEVR